MVGRALLILALALAATPAAHAGTFLMTGDCTGPRMFSTCLFADDGSDAAPRALTHDLLGTDFTPDGRTVIGPQPSLRGDRPSSLYAIGTDGSGLRTITTAPAGIDLDVARAAPDGAHVAYWTYAIEPSQIAANPPTIHVVGLDGSGDHAIARGGPPAWTPTGDVLYEGRDSELHVIHPDGTGDRVITRGANLTRVAMSPDGRRVAYSGILSDNRWALYVMDADGGHVRQLTDPPGQDSVITWSPDGHSLLFSRTPSVQDSADNFFTLDVDAGTPPAQLTSNVSFTSGVGITAWGGTRVAPQPTADRAGPGVILQGQVQAAGARAAAATVVLHRRRAAATAFDRAGVRQLTVAVDGGRPRALAKPDTFTRMVERLHGARHRLVFATRDGAGHRRRTAVRVALR
jgi:hypothetical protein